MSGERKEVWSNLLCFDALLSKTDTFEKRRNKIG